MRSVSGRSLRLQVTLQPRGYELNPITVTTSRGVQRLPDAPASVSVVGTEQMARIPLGVVTPTEVSSEAASLLLTYRNFGDVDVHGADLQAGYRVPPPRQMRLQLDVRNEFDNGYRSFPGAPELGRFAMARVVYEF